MTPLLLAFATFLSTSLGGLIGLKNQKRIHRFLGYTAGVLIGVVAFDLLPEIFNITSAQHYSPTGPMVALVVGFLLFHIIEKSILIHHAAEEEYKAHHHP